MFFSKKKPHMIGCLICHVVVAILLFLTALGALCNLVQTYYIGGKIIFAGTPGSLALIAFAISMSLWMQSMKSCMGECEVCSGMKK